MQHSSSRPPRLTSLDDYHTWCIYFEGYCDEHEYTQYLTKKTATDGTATPLTDAEQKLDHKVRGVLLQSLPETLVKLAAVHKTTHEMWTWLKDRALGSLMARAAQLEQEEDDIHFNPATESCMDYVIRVETLYSALSDAGTPYPQSHQIKKMTRGLPKTPEWSNAAGNLKANKEANLSIENFKAALRGWELHIAETTADKGAGAFVARGGAGSSGGSGRKQKPKFKGACWHCGIKGHRSEDCFKRKAEQQRGAAGGSGSGG